MKLRIAAFVCSVAIALPAQAQLKDGAVVVDQVDAVVTVTKVDPKARTVTFRGPKGNTLALKAAEDVPLDQLNAGDRITLVYTEALAVEMVAQAPAKAPAKKDK